MKSMTGYAYKESASERFNISLEIKAYNNRFLDVFVTVPSFLSPLEPRLRELVAQGCQRGKVEVIVRVKEMAVPAQVTVDTINAKAYYDAINALASDLGVVEKVGLDTILSLEGVLTSERRRDPEDYWAVLVSLFEAVFAEFEASRIREGKATERDILKHIGIIESFLSSVTSQAPLLEQNIKDNLRARFRDTLGDLVDENRVLAETAILLMKYTISEELSRLKAHLDDFRAEITRNPAPGKKLDFLCQEMNREINTIGSKSPQLDVSRAVVEMKNALENIREQLRNVE